MEVQERILRDLPAEDPEDLDFLLEFAELVRGALWDQRHGDLCTLIRYAVRHSCWEAFYWTMGILEEIREKAGAEPEPLNCVIGKHIPDYDAFVCRLGVDLNAFENDVQPVRDENGEVQAFFNIIRYKTAFTHIDLVSSENFDAKDNDYIEYMLICS